MKLHSLPISISFYLLLPTAAQSKDPMCQDPTDRQTLPFCNTALPAVDRAKDLVARLTQDEKIQQLNRRAPSVDHVGLQAYNWWNEALHGVSGSCTHDGRCPTSYPMPIGLGATFNVGLIQQIASQISSEARRMNTENEAESALNPKWVLIGLDFWAPNINIFRDPRWGRGMETPGEDPYLNGQYAIHFVKGMQEGEDPRYYKTIATLKHYAAYSIETNRSSFDAVVSDEDLVQTYLPAFEAGIKEGRAGSVMCAFNALNGDPSCASSFLLQEVLRDEWDWDGYVVSDCDAVALAYTDHKIKASAEEVCSVALKAGCDLDCGDFYRKHLGDAIQKSLIRDEDLDKALVRIFTATIRLGMLDAVEQQPYRQYPPETIGHPDHVTTAVQAARESIVLLKNENGFLPLNSSSVSKIAAIGPHFDATWALVGNYHRDVPPITSPIEGLKNSSGFRGTVVGAKGCDLNKEGTSLFDEATKAASDSDVAILFVGINGGVENEDKDRISIGLPGSQYDLIDAVAKVQSKTVLVLINGGSVDISAAKENSNIVAIVEAFYPGMKGGDAIADVLFGKYNPSGRLPYTMHKMDFVDRVPMEDMSMTGGPGRTYRYFKGDVVYPFGHGMSYTTFAYETKEIELLLDETDGSQNGAKYRVKVTNTGNIAGDTSVLAFLSFTDDSSIEAASRNAASYSCPLSQLFGFQKIHLQAGESKEIFFSADASALKCYHRSQNTLGSPYGRYTVSIIGDETRQILKTTDNVTIRAG